MAGAQQAQSWSMPQVSIPGGLMGAADTFADSAFSDRMQRKKERKENQEIQRARQLEVDAVNQERYLTSQAQMANQLALQAEDRTYQRGRQATSDEQAATRHEWAGETHQNNQTNQVHKEKLNSNTLKTSNMNLELANKSFGFKENANDIRKSILTEQQQELENTYNFYNDQVEKGAMTEAEREGYNEKLRNSVEMGTLDPTQVTDIAGYQSKMYSAAMNGGASSAEAKTFAENSTTGASSQSELATEKFKADTKAINEARKAEIADNKGKDEPGSIDIVGAMKVPGMENLGNKWFGSYSGSKFDESTGKTNFVSGSKIGQQELSNFMLDYSKRKLPTSYDKKGSVTGRRKPTSKQINEALSVSLDNGGAFGAMSDFVDGERFDAAIKSIIMRDKNKNNKKSAKKIFDTHSKKANDVYNKAKKASGAQLVRDALGYNQNANNNAGP